MATSGTHRIGGAPDDVDAARAPGWRESHAVGRLEPAPTSARSTDTPAACAASAAGTHRLLVNAWASTTGSWTDVGLAANPRITLNPWEPLKSPCESQPTMLSVRGGWHDDHGAVGMGY